MRKVIELLEQVEIPQVVRIRQPLDCSGSIEDLRSTVGDALERSGLRDRVVPGMRVAVGVGSRGIYNIPDLVLGVLDWLRGRGTEPFIVPAMGSHGGGRPESQKKVLAGLGITEDVMGCTIKSQTDAVRIGIAAPGLEVWMDRHASEADGVLVINRVKPHNAFRAENESGIVKMLAIGLGKQKGAASCHARGFEGLPERMNAAAAYLMEHAPILGGVAVVENAGHRPCLVEAVPAEVMFDRDAALLREAWKMLPKLPLDYTEPSGTAHVLVLDEMGKNISGSGMDTNVLGRYATPFLHGGPRLGKLAVLDLTPESEGNAVGMGLADFITWRLRDKIDFEAVYANGITATMLNGARMPCALPSDLDVIRAAVKTCNENDPAKLRFLRAKNTMELEMLEVSSHMVEEMLSRDCEIISEPHALRFSETGDLATS
jgi:hypothetical protein